MPLTLPAILFTAVLAHAAGLQSDIEYGKTDDASLKMDAWMPEGDGPFPAVILVHGGGWTGGDKQTLFKPMFDPLSKAGFVWFTINYRLAPKYRYPAAVDDVVTAIKYVQAHAAEYKVDTKRLAIAGESSGGQLVALVGARYGRDLHLAAVVCFYPPTDLEALVTGADKTERAQTGISKFLGYSEVNPEAIRLMHEASPVTYVAKGMPPFLFVHGTADPLVNFRQSTEMCDKMKAAGSSCEIYAVEGAPHSDMVWERNPAWQGYKQKVPEWLKGIM